MPDIGNRELAIIRLYQKCEKYHVLPYSGGMLEQPKWIMSCFDYIEDTLGEIRKEKELDDKFAEQVEAQKKALYGGY